MFTARRFAVSVPPDRTSIHTILMLLLLVISFPLRLHSQGKIEWLSDTLMGAGISPQAVSYDGKAFMGYVELNQYVSPFGMFRWDSTGYHMLDSAGKIWWDWSSGGGISGDGKMIAGTMVNKLYFDPYNYYTSGWAFRWTDSTGMVLLPTPAASLSQNVMGVDSAGDIIVGQSYQTNGNFPLMWKNGVLQTMTGIDQNTYPAGITADGSVIFGYTYYASPVTYASEPQASLWSGGTLTLIPLPPGAVSSQASGASRGGAVVIGSVDNKIGFRYTANGGMVFLGSNTVLKGISADGKMIIGTSVYDARAVVWYGNNTTPQDLTTKCIRDYGIDLQGRTLQAATQISGDRSTILGWGGDVTGNSWQFRLVLPRNIIAQIPDRDTVWVAKQWDTIRWEVPPGINKVNIYYSLDGGTTRVPISLWVSADQDTIGWAPPDTLLRNCKIIVTAYPDTTMVGESRTFAIRKCRLSRIISATNTYEEFVQAIHGYSFGNERQYLWPGVWWQQFDYKYIDPVTGNPYPFRPPFSVTSDSMFPDWPLFVKVFGTGQCYWSVTRPTIYKDKAVTKWSTWTRAWGGSCAGFAISTLMAFDDKPTFRSGFPSVPDYSKLYDLTCTDSLRTILNRLWLEQNGEAHWDYLNANWNTTTPTQTLNRLHDVLMSDYRDDPWLYIANNHGNGAHAIVPYAIETDPGDPTGAWIKVYDNSYPADTLASIWVDTTANGGKGRWYYSNLSTWGGAHNLFLMDPVSTYYEQVVLPGAEQRGAEPALRKISFSSTYEIDASSGASIIITDSLGRRIGSRDSLYQEIPGAVPIEPATGSEQPPLGYVLPQGSYRVTLDEFTSAQASFAFFGDSMHCTYGRTDAVAGQADSVTINGVSGMTVSSADAVVKHVSLKTTIEEASDEKVFQVDGLGISKGDPISMKSRRAGQISLAHNGTTPATYDLNIRLASANGEKIFSHAGITLPGNATVTIVPHWSSFSGDSTMLILIDHGNTGTPNDSIVISNEATGVNELKQLTIPKYFSLSQNYPNPFNPTTMLNYGIPEESYVHLTVYNTLGQLVASLVDAVRRGGLYQVRFTNPNLSSGIYFYRLDATSIQYPSKHFSQTRKMLLVK